MNKKKKIMKYSKEILAEYILQNMFLDFEKLDLIKSELELKNIKTIQTNQNTLLERFEYLKNEIMKETDTEKLNKAIKEMKEITKKIKKNENKTKKILKY